MDGSGSGSGGNGIHGGVCRGRPFGWPCGHSRTVEDLEEDPDEDADEVDGDVELTADELVDFMWFEPRFDDPAKVRRFCRKIGVSSAGPKQDWMRRIAEHMLLNRRA